MDTSEQPVPRGPYVLLPVLHLLFALSGPVYYLAAVAGDGWSLEGGLPDANIGAGLAIMWTALFGLPWSIPIWMIADLDAWSGNVNELVYAALALLNVALHAALMRWLYRRVVRRSQRPVTSTPG